MNLVNVSDIYGGRGGSASPTSEEPTASEASSMARVVSSGNNPAYTLLMCFGVLVIVRVAYEMAD